MPIVIQDWLQYLALYGVDLSTPVELRFTHEDETARPGIAADTTWAGQLLSREVPTEGRPGPA